MYCSIDSLVAICQPPIFSTVLNYGKLNTNGNKAGGAMILCAISFVKSLMWVFPQKLISTASFKSCVKAYLQLVYSFFGLGLYCTLHAMGSSDVEQVAMYIVHECTSLSSDHI